MNVFDEVDDGQGLYPEFCQRTNKKEKKEQKADRAKGIHNIALLKTGRGHGPATWTWTNNIAGFSRPRYSHLRSRLLRSKSGKRSRSFKSSTTPRVHTCSAEGLINRLQDGHNSI